MCGVPRDNRRAADVEQLPRVYCCWELPHNTYGDTPRVPNVLPFNICIWIIEMFLAIVEPRKKLCATRVRLCLVRRPLKKPPRLSWRRDFPKFPPVPLPITTMRTVGSDSNCF